MRRSVWALLLCALPLAALATDQGVLRREVILIRHGVRSPTSAPEALARYARDPWPSWPVAPGVLTEHGAQGMRSIGALYRERLRQSGLWDGDCAHGRQVVLIADSTPRNRLSAAALGQGLAKACPLPFLAREVDEVNPLFHFQPKDDDMALPAPAAADATLLALQDVLFGCHGEACRTDAAAAGREWLVDAQGRASAQSIKRAGSLSENLMLEYAEGMPLDQVAWGRADAKAIGRLIALHNHEFALTKQPLPNARRSASNLLAHIGASLDAGAGERPAVAALAGDEARVLILVGHDTNLAEVAGLLGMSWHDAAQPDDYPPGGALVFDLWEKHGRYSVTVHTVLPTLDGLRQGELTAGEMIDTPVVFGACRRDRPCPLAAFDAWLKQRIDAQSVQAALPSMRE